ncbi:hypothetical protein BBBOND_0206740 [Babesia bigemina]|uniref:Uncharacterized protein n=1 Tax=Babesia bigemina TaxID=5866 RepID=A0A061D443_BABBI|nr:hypothetical protein BBBOND_0206740 [Babesia bigemina]CDR95516.1 hypothetical protein BBBOND_0206740 [Babesia bigemina]|eukprot:XP_012767702.1 hypothetical protein BBBOND_0206740 [Babesia bigemina]
MCMGVFIDKSMPNAEPFFDVVPTLSHMCFAFTVKSERVFKYVVTKMECWSLAAFSLLAILVGETRGQTTKIDQTLESKQI